MRIVQVYKDVHPFVRGGIERYVHDLSAFLAGRGHDVTVLVAGRGGRRRELSGFTVLEYPCLCRVLSNPVSPGLGAVLGSTAADVFHFHLPLPSAVMAWSMSGYREPYAATYHSDIVRQAFLMPFYGPFLRRFLRRAGRVLATSPAYRDTSIYLSGLDNVSVVPIGVDLAHFRPSGRPSEGYALFVGRFRGYKGIEVLMEAWRNLPGRRLVMVGGGPLEGRIRSITEDSGMKIELRGELEDDQLLETYRGASFLVLPSTMRSEAFGMVQVEAMACGVPVISTGIPTGVPWVNMHGVSGLVVPPGDPEALADAVRSMEDPATRDSLSAGALERARGTFDSRSLFAEVEELLIEVADEVRGGRG
ncbi:MAG: hypothetical protein AVO35_03870 [Candidatus Aegiribacteria sp. MLS_C]|nr:MAG: hypothetical protein AVO35_03870 [Candidatus Aegiribacteria sp. MLS_C]